MRAFRPRDIFHLRRLQDVAIAPDGEVIAYSLAEPDQSRGGYMTRIYRLGLDDRVPRPLTHGPHDRRPWFAPDGRHLAFLRRAGETDQVHLLPLSGGEALQLTTLRHGVDAYAWGPHGRQIAAVTTVGPAGPTGRQLYLFHLDGSWRQLSDDEFDHRDLIFAPGGSHIACLVVQSDGAEAAIGLVPVDGGPWRSLTPWQASWSRPVFAPDGSCIYAVGAALGEEPALWRVQLQGGAPECLARAPWPGAFAPYMLQDGLSDGDLFVSSDGQGLRGLLQQQSDAVLARCSLPSGRWQVERTQGRRIHAFAATASGDRVALLAGPPDQPPEAQLRDESGRMLLRSDHHELFLADTSFAPLQPLGDALSGAGLLLPLAGPRPAPLVVILGDTPDPATGGASSLLAQALCGRGLAVLCLPLRPAAAAAAVREPRALLAQLESLIAEPRPSRQALDPSRLGLCGEGVGGYLALLLLTLSPAFQAAVTLGAATDLVSLWGSGDLPAATALTDLAPPWQDPTRHLRQSPLLQADSIQTPLLLLQGQEDRIVPLQQALELKAALETLTRGVRCEIYPGLGHEPLGQAPLRLQAQILEVMVGWFWDHLAQ